MIYLPGPDDYVAALGSAIGRPARLFFRPKCDVTVSNWSDEREGQNEQVPAYSMCIRTAFVVCIRRGEITGAASRGKQPDARRRRCSEDGTDPCRCFWKKPADLLFLRSPPRLLRQRYQYPCYQATGTWHSRDRGCNRLPQLRKGKHPDAWALTKAGLGLRFNEHIWKATARPCSRTLAVSASKASSPSARAQAIAPAARPIG